MPVRTKNIVTSNKGFTLVELLIVVAIIGVLASQGVPAYKRMVQKSRKGEAQMLLGNIATAESGFFQEYGQYSTNVARLGAMAEGTNFTYAAGFPTGVCNAVPVAPTVATVPNLPVNFNTGVPGPAAAGGGLLTSMIGRVANNVPAAQARNLCAVAAVAPMFLATGVVAPAGGNAGTFVASATGNIVDPNGANGITCPLGALANCDQWYINQDRTLRNVRDGVMN